MNFSEIIFIIAGVSTIFMGVTPIGMKIGRMRRWANRFGEIPTRILYVIIGIGLLVFAFSGALEY